MTKLKELEAKLVEAVALCEYWRKRRHGQVGNCPSDVYATDEAWRKRQGLEYQIRELKNELRSSLQHS